VSLNSYDLTVPLHTFSLSLDTYVQVIPYMDQFNRVILPLAVDIHSVQSLVWDEVSLNVLFCTFSSAIGVVPTSIRRHLPLTASIHLSRPILF